MNYDDLLEHVDVKWRLDFERFLADEGDASEEFEEVLNKDESLQRLIEVAIERKVAEVGDMRQVFWSEIAQANRIARLELERAIKARLGVIGTTGLPANAAAERTAPKLLEEIQRLRARIGARESSSLDSPDVTESIQRVAASVANLAVGGKPQ